MREAFRSFDAPVHLFGETWSDRLRRVMILRDNWNEGTALAAP